MKTLAASILFLSIPVTALALQIPTPAATVGQSLSESIHSDTAAALAALEKGDYRDAALHLNTAGGNANRLSLQDVAQKIQIGAPSFIGEPSNFVLADSTTVLFENFLKNRNALETRFKDEDGNIVTVRVFGGEKDLKDFMAIASDQTMLEKGRIVTAEMKGEQALKRKSADGGLSVIMMSEKDHALVEFEGSNEESVMTFIKDLEDGE